MDKPAPDLSSRHSDSGVIFLCRDNTLQTAEAGLVGKLHIGAHPNKEADLAIICIAFTQDRD